MLGSMNETTSTAELLKGDLSRHSPMMAQHMGVTSFSNIHNPFSPTVNCTVPS